MKRITILSLICWLVSVSCETEHVIFTGPYFVRFTDSSQIEKESNTKTIKLSVHLASPALKEDVSINYSISGNARENVDYTIISPRGTVTIPKGSYFGYIELKLINNSNNILRSQEAIFTLTTVNNSALRVGQSEGGIGKKFTLTIEDDCILNGSYLAGYGTPNKGVTISSQDCERYQLSNWNIDLFNSTDPMDLIFTDNGDNTLTIPEQEEENIPEELATIQGTGIIDPVTGNIILNIILVDLEDQPQISLKLNRN